MKAVAKKGHMIRLQEENCKRQADVEQYCAEQCKIE